MQVDSSTSNTTAYPTQIVAPPEWCEPLAEWARQQIEKECL